MNNQIIDLQLLRVFFKFLPDPAITWKKTFLDRLEKKINPEAVTIKRRTK